MTWQPVDCHAHTTFSDGQLSVDELIARANDRGVVPTVSDHMSRDAYRGLGSVEEIRAYLDVLERHDVLRSGEFCWHDSLWRELEPDLVARFTHRVGSLHAVRLPDGTLVHAFRRQMPDGLAVDAYMRAHLASLETLASEMPIDVLAHPTLVTLAFRELEPESIWTEDHETRMADALYRAGIAFEISNRYPPHRRLLERMRDRGVRFSLGSDGHTSAQVADVAKPLETARALGVPDHELYDPRRHGSKTHP